MPKVKDQYLVEKREQILNAAFEVCMEKPLFNVKMKDIIERAGFSHGLVYRYYSNLEEILFALINRATSDFDFSAAVDRILTAGELPECTVYNLIALHVTVTAESVIGFGKIFFELTTMLAGDPDFYERFRNNVKLASNSDYLKLKSYQYVLEQIENGYFTPSQSCEHIFSFISVCIDGIERDMILTRCYALPGFTDGMPLDSEGLLNSLCSSVIFLLGGDMKKTEQKEVNQ